MKFSHRHYEKLIDLVRERPTLYDCQSPDYKDYRVHKNLWKNIASEMGETDMTGEDWKKVWKQKRDNFMRKRKEILSSKSEAAAKPVSKGPLYDQMLFLCDSISSQSTVSNFLDQTQDLSSEPAAHDSESQADTESLPDTQASPISSPMTSNLPVVVEPLPEANTCLKEKEAQHHYSAGTKAHDRMEKKRTLKMTIDQTPIKSPVNQDDDSNLYIFLSKKTKSLSKETQEWMEDEVMKVYLEARRRDRAMEGEGGEVVSPWPVQMTSSAFHQYVSPTPAAEMYFTKNS